MLGPPQSPHHSMKSRPETIKFHYSRVVGLPMWCSAAVDVAVKNNYRFETFTRPRVLV